MSQNPQEVTNPDLVDVADQGDGPTSVDQPVTTGPSGNPGPVVEGGTYSPQGPDTEEVIANNVAGQVYGTGTPSDVFV